MPKRIHHEEHEGHEEWNSVQATASATGGVQRRAPGLRLSAVKGGFLMNFDFSKLKNRIRRFVF